MDAQRNSQNQRLNLREVTQDAPAKTNPSQQEISFELLPSLSRFLALKDQATHAHSERVAELARDWGQYMQARGQWLEQNLVELECAARLHDLGKIGVLDEVLHKKSALTIEERGLMEQHAEIGYQMIRDYPGISALAEGVRHHHERWDGQGYPLGLKERRIPWLARAIAVVDAFDAMTSHRVYRPVLSELEALTELSKEAGRQFDPDLVRSFIEFLYSRRT